MHHLLITALTAASLILLLIEVFLALTAVLVCRCFLHRVALHMSQDEALISRVLATLRQSAPEVVAEAVRKGIAETAPALIKFHQDVQRDAEDCREAFTRCVGGWQQAQNGAEGQQ